jgi:serine/threonine protein kinase
MERMECGLFQGLPKIVRRAPSTLPFIEIGPIAVRLIELIEAIHQLKHIVVDVKPDNIMFAPDATKTTRKTLEKDIGALAQRLRLVDFGLSQLRIDPMNGKHYANVKQGSLVGTPLYASRHVHDGDTCARRDDVESIGIVIAELLIRIHATLEGTAHEYEKTKIEGYLPWANAGNCDEVIGEAKAEMMKDIRSPFYKRMGSKTAAATMHKYFQATLAMKYSQMPDYDLLKALVADLQATNPNAKARRQSTTSQSTDARSLARGAPKVKESPAKKAKSVAYQAPVEDTSTPGRRRSARLSKEDVISIDDDDDEQDTKPAAVPLKPVAFVPPKASAANKTAKAAAYVVPKAAVGVKAKSAAAVGASAKPTPIKGKPTPFVPGMNGDKKKAAVTKLQEIPSYDEDDDYDDDSDDSKPRRRGASKTKDGAAKGQAKVGKPVAFRPSAAKASGKPVAFRPAAAAKAGGNDEVEDMEVEYYEKPRSKRSSRHVLKDESEDDDDDDFLVYDGSYSSVFGDKSKKSETKMEDAENAGNNVVPMEIDPKPARFANKTMMVKVISGAQSGTKMTLSFDNATLWIGNGAVKSKEPMLVLSMDDKIMDTHCKLVFGVTASGTPKVVVTPKVDGVVVKTKSLAKGKATTFLRDVTMTIGNTKIYLG